MCSVTVKTLKPTSLITVPPVVSFPLPYRTAWRRSCTLPTRARQTCAGCCFSTAQTSTVMSTNMATRRLCSPASQVQYWAKHFEISFLKMIWIFTYTSNVHVCIGQNRNEDKVELYSSRRKFFQWLLFHFIFPNWYPWHPTCHPSILGIWICFKIFISLLHQRAGNYFSSGAAPENPWISFSVVCTVLNIALLTHPPSPGKTDITWMMLDAGAETDVVNSVGRTAAQMAAFVG